MPLEAVPEHAKSDYAFFVRWYFPHYAKSPTARFHVEAAERIKAERNLRAVFEWARGHAKSTHMALLVPLWLKACGEIRTMVLVSKSLEAAKTLLSDLRAELEGNRLYVRDFGEQVTQGDWKLEAFTARDGVAFFARGRGQSPRGLRKRAARPDYIVIDDLDDDALVASPAQAAKALDWVLTALFGALDMGRGRFVMVGNRIGKDSVLAKVAARPGVFHSVVNALDEHGEPAWKEKYTRAEIERMAEFMGYRRAQKELFNNPVSEGAVFRAEWVRFVEAPAPEDCEALVAYCDPSFKSGPANDFKAVAFVGKKDGVTYVLGAFVRRCSVAEMVRYFYDLAERLPSQASCRYFMEANFVQDALLDEFEREGRERGFQLPLRPDRRKKPNKFQRIEALSPLFERKLVAFDAKQERDPDVQALVEQLLAFSKGSRAADDAPDALEGAVYQLARFTSGGLKPGQMRSGR